MSGKSGGADIQEIVDELARVFCDRDEARLVALRAGFPPQDLPAFSTSLVFWSRVIEDAAAGKLRGGMQAVVEQAASRYPSNPVFVRHEGRTGPTTPTPSPAPRPGSVPTAGTVEPAVILLCTANAADPRHRLRLEEELRAIEEALQRSRRRDLYAPRMSLAVSFTKVLHEIDDHEPTFVHFSGHGDESGNLVLKGETSEELHVPPARIAELLEVLPKRPLLVTFATCYSRTLAEVAARHAEYAIGFDGKLDDSSAPSFSATLYERLASRAEIDVPRAFRLAQIACKAEGHESVRLGRLFEHPGREVG